MQDDTSVPAEGTITLERRGALLLIGINRPAKYNGFTPRMFRELGEAYTLLDDDASLRVGVLHAFGPHFTAVHAVHPADGAVPVPSPAAILKGTAEPEIAKKVYDWFFSPAAQQAIIAGGMYSPLPGQPSPSGARPWEELSGQLQPWSPAVLQEVFGQRDAIKAQFSKIVLN